MYDDSFTVAALIKLLQRHDGERPASAVGWLYQEAGGFHRHVFQAYGGVAGFVAAHANIFTLVEPGAGEGCPRIRLVTATQHPTAVPCMKKQRELAPICRFYQAGRCLRGSECRFSHNFAQQVQACSKPLHVLNISGQGRERQMALKTQVLYYLSDENLQHDPFLQGVIASSKGGWIHCQVLQGCPRMQQLMASIPEILYALSEEPGLELRWSPEGSEAVRRTEAPPPLEDKSPFIEACKPPDLYRLERPIELLCSKSPGWKAVIEDVPKRSFCFVKRNSWPAELIQEEFENLYSKTDWIALKSRRREVTRRSAWYVAPNCRCRYTYGEVSMEPTEKPKWLEEVEARVLRDGCGLAEHEWPNSVNFNLYENEDQNVGWHSDDEGLFRGCEQDCRIVSASWGAPRRFDVALKDRNHISGKPSIFHDSARGILLLPGDLCSMEGMFQKHYSHQLAKGATAKQFPAPQLRRINLTWRQIVQHKPYCPCAAE